MSIVLFNMPLINSSKPGLSGISPVVGVGAEGNDCIAPGLPVVGTVLVPVTTNDDEGNGHDGKGHDDGECGDGKDWHGCKDLEGL